MLNEKRIIVVYHLSGASKIVLPNMLHDLFQFPPVQILNILSKVSFFWGQSQDMSSNVAVQKDKRIGVVLTD